MDLLVKKWGFFVAVTKWLVERDWGRKYGVLVGEIGRVRKMLM